MFLVSVSLTVFQDDCIAEERSKLFAGSVAVVTQSLWGRDKKGGGGCGHFVQAFCEGGDRGAGKVYTQPLWG